MRDFAVIGAGPYGLSAAAHLRSVKGIDCAVFGETMSFWDTRMPRGMLLRSPWAASHLSDPQDSLTLDSFAGEKGRRVPRPIPREQYVEYGKWFQCRAAPEVDRRQVLSIRRESAGFALELGSGEPARARRVVVAAGIGPFAHRPEVFRGLPPALVSHASDHHDLSCFSGKRVIVIGAGQSGLETAALLRESGAEVELLARREGIRFLVRSNWLHRLGPVSGLLYSPADVGPAGVSRLVAVPRLYRRLPRGLQDSGRMRCTRPAGSSWLKERLTGVVLSTGVQVTGAKEEGGRLVLALDDGTGRSADHVILATGYRVDVSRYGFLGPSLLAGVRRAEGFPRLTDSFESTVPGLYFIGAPAGWSFGPLMQFVAGAGFTGRRLAHHARAGLGR